MFSRKIGLAQIITIVYCSGASILSVRGQQRVCNTRQRGHSQMQYTELRRRIRSGRWLAGRSRELFRSGSGQRYNSENFRKFEKSEPAWAANDETGQRRRCRFREGARYFFSSDSVSCIADISFKLIEVKI